MSTLTFSTGKFAAKTYNGSSAVTVNIPTNTSHLTNDSGFWTGTRYWANVAISTTSSVTTSPTFSKITLANGITTSLSTTTWLEGNKDKAIINSTAAAGNYVALFKGNSTNGYFTHGVLGGAYVLHYTAKSTVDAGTNSTTKTLELLKEDGTTVFPGMVTTKTRFTSRSSYRLCTANCIEYYFM